MPPQGKKNESQKRKRILKTIISISLENDMKQAIHFRRTEYQKHRPPRNKIHPGIIHNTSFCKNTRYWWNSIHGSQRNRRRSYLVGLHMQDSGVLLARRTECRREKRKATEAQRNVVMAGELIVLVEQMKTRWQRQSRGDLNTEKWREL